MVNRHEDQHRSGLLIALGSFIVLACGDAVVKSLGGEWPGTAVAALRFTLGAAGLGLILWWREGSAGFAVPRPSLQAARGLALAVGSLSFFLSLHIMPLAEATAIQFISPVLTALLSRLLLGERLPKISWAAMLLASVGVILVLRPNVALLGWAAALPLLAAFSMSCFFLLNRISGRDVAPLAAQFWVAMWAAPIQCIAAFIGHAGGWPALHIDWPDASVVLRCAIVAVTASLAHLGLYVATTRASAAIVAPASYVQIIVALSVGILVFGDWPGLNDLAGIAMIVTAGLALWWATRPVEAGIANGLATGER